MVKDNKETPLLEVYRASFSYTTGRKVFDDVTFSLRKGEIFTILGPNGAGKSTLLNCLGKLFPLTSGEIRFKGQNIMQIPNGELAKNIGYVSQMQTMAFDFLVRDYLVLGRAPHIGKLKIPGAEEYRMVDEVMEQMNIGPLANKSILQISGGERQQVLIARVLVQKPQMILMDEPTNHLDYGNQLKILKIIVQLAEEEEMTVIMTTHMPDHAILLGSKTGILDRKGYMKTGTTEEIVNEDNLTDIYRADLHLVYIEQLRRTACVAGNIRQ